jgi:hypothetical protein
MVNQIGENVDAASNLSAAFSRDEDRQWGKSFIS